MEKLTEQQIKDGNRLIAEFMGYIYYHKGVDIDYSDIGGIYERFEIFSKVPILVDEYPDDDQFYFSRVPNPDFGKQGERRFRNDRELIDWDSLNSGEFKNKLKYHEDLNELTLVIDRIKSIKHPIMIYQSHIQNTVEIYDLDSKHYIVRESSTILKPIELIWLTVVNFIKIQNKKNGK